MSLGVDHYRNLLELSRKESLFDGSYDEFVKIAITNLSKELDVSRTSFWSYNHDREVIENQLLYDLDTNLYTEGEVLSKVDFPRYFNAFQTNLIINAPDAKTDARTSEFTDTYLLPNRIESMLDVQVLVDGDLFGIICLEHREKREWNKTEELFLTSTASYVALAYIAKLKSHEETRRKQSEFNYRSLFKDSPIPMWVYDRDSLKFLAVNRAAISSYGYTEDEFLKMSIMDIRPADERIILSESLAKPEPLKWESSRWHHMYKSGEIINVSISSGWTMYKGQKARIVIAQNVTDEVKLQLDKQAYMDRLQKFTFFASHNLRGPVARILGLNYVLSKERDEHERDESHNDLLDKIQYSVEEIDEMIKKLNSILDEEDGTRLQMERQKETKQSES